MERNEEVWVLPSGDLEIMTWDAFTRQSVLKIVRGIYERCGAECLGAL